MNNTMEIYDKGLACLIDNLGVVQAEEFIMTVKSESFDYTKWQREFYDALPEGDFMKRSREYAAEHEYHGNGRLLSEIVDG